MIWWAIPLHQYKWHLDTIQKIHPGNKQSAHTILLNLAVEQIGTYENLWYKTLTQQVGRRREMLKHVTFQWWRHQVFNLTKENTDKKAWAKESKKTGKIYIRVFNKVSECQGEANGYGKYIIPCALKLWLAPSVNPIPKCLSSHSPTQVCLAIHCINTEAKAIHTPPDSSSATTTTCKVLEHERLRWWKKRRSAQVDFARYHLVVHELGTITTLSLQLYPSLSRLNSSPSAQEAHAVATKH